MKNPPASVKLVLQCVCIMLGHIPQPIIDGKVKTEEAAVAAWWNESIRVMSDFHFLVSYCRTFDGCALGGEIMMVSQRWAKCAYGL